MHPASPSKTAKDTADSFEPYFIVVFQDHIELNEYVYVTELEASVGFVLLVHSNRYRPDLHMPMPSGVVPPDIWTSPARPISLRFKKAPHEPQLVMTCDIALIAS